MYAEELFRKLGAKDKSKKDAIYIAISRLRQRKLITTTRFGTYKLTRKGNNFAIRLKRE
ncbi:MAG: hypothetical protein GTO23_04410 [Nitrososphaeria archaeon]|nr:hypothetical protein [Nitrososphaeria archaeon]